MKKLNITSILLVSAIIVVANVLSQKLFFRLDFTEGKQYTLSKATKDILKNLDTPVTVTGYFSEKNLPPEMSRIREEFRQLLTEYRSASGNMIDYEFINPNKDQTTEQEALQNGIRPVVISVREKDQSRQQKAFLGAVLKMGEQKEVLPVVVTGEGMEYALTTAIKKMSVKDKPFVGIIQGHGEPAIADLAQARNALSILYTVMPVNLDDEGVDLSQFRTLALVAPADSIPENHFSRLEEYLARGGNLLVAINRVNGDLQTQSGSVLNTGLETWLKSKGIEVEPAFVIDNLAGNITVQQKQGFFIVNTQVPFPFLPLVRNFAEHPVTKGLEQVLLPFASPVNFTGSEGSFTTLISSSSKAGQVQAPTYFDVINKKWSEADFPMSNLPLGGVLEGLPGGGRLIVFGDGDFPVSGQGGQTPDNVNLFVNSIDWLSDDTGLIELRTKSIASRPIDEAWLGDEAAGKRNTVKLLNFGLPILLVILYGIFRSRQRMRLRMKRMQESYV